jgi:hypothetical protein
MHRGHSLTVPVGQRRSSSGIARRSRMGKNRANGDATS